MSDSRYLEIESPRGCPHVQSLYYIPYFDAKDEDKFKFYSTICKKLSDGAKLHKCNGLETGIFPDYCPLLKLVGEKKK